MRRADRLFQIIQILRRSTRPITAAALGRELEVSPRTVYRDIADLIGQRVPIAGEAGLGYIAVIGTFLIGHEPERGKNITCFDGVLTQNTRKSFKPWRSSWKRSIYCRSAQEPTGQAIGQKIGQMTGHMEGGDDANTVADEGTATLPPSGHSG